MTQAKKWDVWWASVRFEDKPEAKQRPVVILSSGIVYVCALKVTSQEPRSGDYVLSLWQYAGLIKPSTVRIDKVIKLKQQEMSHRIGALHPVDILAIQKMLAGL